MLKQPKVWIQWQHLQNMTNTLMVLLKMILLKFFPTSTLTGVLSQSCGISSLGRCCWAGAETETLLWKCREHWETELQLKLRGDWWELPKVLCYCLITLLYHYILASHTWVHLLCLQQELGSHTPGQLVTRTPGPSLEYRLCSRLSENDPLEHCRIPCPEFLLLNVQKLDYWKVYILWALKSDVKYTRKSALLLKSLPSPPGTVSTRLLQFTV